MNIPRSDPTIITYTLQYSNVLILRKFSNAKKSTITIGALCLYQLRLLRAYPFSELVSTRKDF